MASDIKMKRVTATGALNVGRARVRQVQVTVGGTAGRFTITDGSGGEVILDLDFAPNGTYAADIPDIGILAASDPFVSAATNITAATIYYA
ncbi:MAG TPA: hypothetical protein VGP45_08265 [Marinobacter sp.]|nr:hypothetical protein [Marinobacter sp.]